VHKPGAMLGAMPRGAPFGPQRNSGGDGLAERPGQPEPGTHVAAPRFDVAVKMAAGADPAVSLGRRRRVQASGGMELTDEEAVRATSCMDSVDETSFADDQRGRFSDSCSSYSVAFSSAGGEARPGTPCDLPDVPAGFRCIVNGEIMEDPVVLMDGRCCDRANVDSLGYSGELLPNSTLREAIQAFLELRDIMEQQQEDWNAFYQHRQYRWKKELRSRDRQVQALRVAVGRNRQRIHQLRYAEGKPSMTRAASNESGSVCDGASDPTSTPDRSQPDSWEPLFICGPAPRPVAAEASHKLRPPRRSTWSVLRQATGRGGT